MKPNAQLLMLEESTGKLVLDNLQSNSLNRYQFVYRDTLASLNSRAFEMLTALQQELASSSMNVLVWTSRAAGVDFGLRSKRYALERKKQGYTVVHDGALYLASKLDPSSKSFLYTIQESCHPNTGALFLFGTLPRPDIFFSSSLRPSMELLALRGEFSPTRDLIQWMEEIGDITLVYLLKDEIGNLTVVVITSRKLSFLPGLK